MLVEEAWKAELLSLDTRKAALTVALAEPKLPVMHPQMAEVFRQKASTLAAGLEHDERRDAARLWLLKIPCLLRSAHHRAVAVAERIRTAIDRIHSQRNVLTTSSC